MQRGKAAAEHHADVSDLDGRIHAASIIAPIAAMPFLRNDMTMADQRASAMRIIKHLPVWIRPEICLLFGSALWLSRRAGSGTCRYPLLLIIHNRDPRIG